MISGVDPEDGTHYAGHITKDDLAAGLADASRLHEDEERGPGDGHPAGGRL